MSKDDIRSPAAPGPRSGAVPGSRAARFSRMLRLASGVAGGMLAEGGRQLARGQRPSGSDLLLTPANARRVADQLSRLRGAAMKMGQLLSMDAGDMLPPELADILSRLRAEAHAMPARQLQAVLDAQWGAGWETKKVYRFDYQPIAAASIGQVHEALSQQGQRLAVKIQYPGVRRSIDSDVDNVATLLRLSRLLPAELDIGPLLAEAKLQLHAEADYLREAGHLKHYRAALADEPCFVLPEVDDALTTGTVLAMTYMRGKPIDSLQGAPRRTRDRAATLLMALFFRELFEFRRVQTDPNFANYLYCPASERLVLLDFGATRVYRAEFADAYRQMFAAAVAGDGGGIIHAATAIGYFDGELVPEQRRMILDLVGLATEPFRAQGSYDFGASDLPARLSEAGMAFRDRQEYWHSPPADALFLHRKLAGLFLLASRLRARVDMGELARRHL